MRPKWTLPFLGLLALSMLFIPGCNLSSANPTCRTLDGLAMTLKDPTNGAMIADINPTLTWNNVSPTCNPDHYEVKLRADDGTMNSDVEVSGWTTSWTPPEALKVGTTYFWQVIAWEEADTTTSSYIPSSPEQYFFVGAECGSETTLQAPVLLQPADNSVIYSYTPYFTWQNPNACMVFDYTLEVSTDSRFSDKRLWNGTVDGRTSMRAAFPLADCTRYFWRVVPFMGEPNRPNSLVNTFYVGTMVNCPAEAPGSIGGLVSESLGSDKDLLPYGPVFPGIAVHFSFGHCPAQLLLTMLTDSSGRFNFSDNQPGTYCLWVDASEPDNAAILGNGSWVPEQGSPGSSQYYQDISLAAGQTISDIGFDWHPSLTYFIPNMNAYCRSGPDLSFSQISVAMKDQSYLIDGRNEDDTWYHLNLTGQVACWVSADTGTATADTSGIQVILAQPTPGMTPLPSGNTVDCTNYAEESCNAHLDVCQWVPKMTAPNTGNCVNK